MKPIRIEKKRLEPKQFAPSVMPPRGVLHAPEGRNKSFYHQRIAVPAQLSPFIQHYWYVQWDHRNTEPGTAETLPHPNCYLVFEHDLEKPLSDECVIRRAEVSGVHTGKFSRAMEGRGRVFGLKFQPGGIFPYLRKSVSTLTDLVVPAGQVFGPGINTLAKRLRSLKTSEAMSAAANAYLLSHLPEPDRSCELAASLVEAILHDSEILTVEVLSRRSGLSVRTLQRLFKMYVGVTPKWVIRRYRLHELLKRLNSGESFGAAQLAVDLGYADQAHLINDFRKLAGVAPTEYLRRIRK
jgi:AraC-like DNA-binding protein